MKAWARRLSLILLLVSFGSGCGNSAAPNNPGSPSDWKELLYDLSADASLNSVVQDISGLSGVSFSLDPELQAKLDTEPVDLPVLLGLNIGQVLTLVQDTMPPETAFLYEEVSGQSILLRLRFQQAEDLAAADPVTIVDFDEFAELGFSALISDPLFEEECDGPEEL